jgi:hypothetical protein
MERITGSTSCDWWRRAMHARTNVPTLAIVLGLMTIGVVEARPAAAQEGLMTAGASRPAALTVALGGLASFGGAGIDLRLSADLPVSDRKSIEFFAGVSESGDYLDTKAVYGLQVRRLTGGRGADYQAYSSIGFMGLIARYETADCSYGHCVRTTSNHLLPPVLFLVGGGVDFDVKPRLRMHMESQVAFALVVPVSVRVAIGVSIPLGHGTASKRAAATAACAPARPDTCWR